MPQRGDDHNDDENRSKSPKSGSESADGADEDDEELEKKKNAVTEFSSFSQLTVTGEAMTGVTLRVRVVVVERKDTNQRWPFSVLVVTDGAPARPEEVEDDKKSSTSSSTRDKFEQDDDGLEAQEEEAQSLCQFDVIHTIDGESIWRPGALDLQR